MSKPGSGIRRLERSNVTGGGGGKRQKVSGRAHSPFGLSLPQIEKALRNLGHEEAVLLDKDGNFVATFRGTKTEVNIPDAFYYLQGLTATHNHPKGIWGFGGGLSIADFANFADSNWHQIRAVADGQGAGLYIARRGANARSKAFTRYLNLFGGQLRKKLDAVYDKTLDEELMKNGNLMRAYHIAGQKAFGLIHAKMKKVAPYFGFDYVRRKRPFR